MQVNEVVKALRWIASNDEICFNAEQANNAADLLEQQQTEIKQITKDRDQWRVAAEASRDVIQPKLRAEIKQLKASQIRRINYESCTLCDSEHACETKTIRECKDMLLKASQPVRCGDCIYCEHDDISYFCQKGLCGYNLKSSDYCSYGERRVEE